MATPTSEIPMGTCAVTAGRQSVRAGAPPWMGHVLRLAAAYNLLWGTLIVIFPLAPFRWAGMAAPLYPWIWQCLGMVVGVYGVGYGLAATNPLRHWPIVFAGLLGKVLGPLGFLWWALAGVVPWSWGWVIVANDLIWWVPFGLILASGLRTARIDALASGTPAPLPQRDVLDRARTQDGTSLATMARERPVLLVFLRHSGCTFCRETLYDLQRIRPRIAERGVSVALIHMASEARIVGTLARYGLEDAPRVSDPEQRLFRAFGLRRGTLRQLFGPKVWWRGFLAGVLGGHGVGLRDADGFQMPGVFLVSGSTVLARFVHRTAADRPDYLALIDVGLARRRRAG